ncbi:conserved hypothetical protein [Hyella patelloides LEGE 07179]|uniref:Uncharacterized protein n=1 Tax=Hyella patelloides LEGE 07179 TaxID=945734 RepID=A0A563VN95_9CYAN|nr:hypothetical protein [Hyella patelloides]VEP12898.1 conserved hypothetical protein [Hyella patelloides LEGE 07179]
MTQYYQLTLKDALTQYQAGFLSSAGLLFNYFKIKFAPGWKIYINQQAICDELCLSSYQFYRGLKLIKQHFPNLKLHRTTALVGEFEEPNTSSDEKNPVNEPVVETTNPVAPTATPVVETTNPVAPTATPVVETATGAPPKPRQTTVQSDSPDSSSNSYSNFISSLSQSQREKFLAFCTSQANQLPKPPILIKRWIQHNWSELRSLWCKKFPDVVYENGNISHDDWQNHPRFNKWKRRLECQYDAPYFITLLKNGGTEEERRAFARWAIDNEIVKVPEGVTIEKL